MFNSGKNVGDLNDNLTLQTKGKVYIQYGQKFVELLNNKGELNVPFLSEIKELISMMKSSKEGDVLRYNGKNFEQYNVDNKFGEIEKGINNARRSSGIQYSENQQISVDYSSIQFENIGGSQELLINNEFNQKLSIKEKSDSWINAKISGSTLTVNVDSNPGQRRSGYVTVQTESEDTLNINVEQDKIFISGEKGRILISFDYINDDNVTNNHLYLTGYQGQIFKVYCKKIGSDGLVPGDMSLSKAPKIVNDEYGIIYYNSQTYTQGDNYVYQFKVLDEITNNKIFNLQAQFNEDYNKSNIITSEYSEEHTTVCYVKGTTEQNENYLYTLNYDSSSSPSTVMEQVTRIDRDYNEQSGFITFECVKKNDGQNISITNYRLYYLHMFGVGSNNESNVWYNINDERISNNEIKISYSFGTNNYVQDRSIKMGFVVNFDDGTQYNFEADIYQYPLVYLRASGDYSTVPANRNTVDPGHMVGCDGSYPVTLNYETNYSERITYYATKYLNSPTNSYFNQSGTNFVKDSQGTVKLMFDEDSTAQIDSIDDHQNGTAYINLKPNTTDDKLQLYFYLDYVDNDGNIIATSRTLDRRWERDNIVQNTCN